MHSNWFVYYLPSHGLCNYIGHWSCCLIRILVESYSNQQQLFNWKGDKKCQNKFCNSWASIWVQFHVGQKCRHLQLLRILTTPMLEISTMVCHVFICPFSEILRALFLFVCHLLFPIFSAAHSQKIDIMRPLTAPLHLNNCHLKFSKVKWKTRKN